MKVNEQSAEKFRDDLDYFSKSIRERIEAYDASPLSIFHDHLLKIFFDLSQRYEGLDSFYQICVSLPLSLHAGISSSLAVLNNRKNSFQLVCCSDPETSVPSHLIANIPLFVDASSSVEEGLLLLPLVARPLPDSVDLDLLSADAESLPCLGVLFIAHFEQLSDTDLLFLEKLVTRMGYNLQRRLLQLSHLDHVNFIKRLGRDIGHNVITPNMHFKNLFRQLEKKIQLIDDEVRETVGMADGQSLRIINRCNEIRSELGSTHEELLGHYNRTSLYLETLLREEHFSKGRFILKKRLCRIEQDIILPELEIYRKRFIRRGISIEQPVNMQENPICLYGDAGLLSQVFDNLFSNALKYTTETADADGTLRKGIAYGCRDVENFPKKGERGAKFTVFSRGEHLSADESLTVFNDGVRGENAGHNPGSGHGLAFVRNVVEIHGGEVGYEAVPGGNNFYFILPLAATS